ncbi:hypothetical protein FUA48_14480 [Flavobacterium alkalisoli]|uniref:Lipoprotein n=1 Tax=Flavobacterium alkalisoli TaxID=2602769 RepID=A0A5B9FWS8_9FLAO|nr:DUF6452 family protein [Flavobacterium alkalisoli]QEE50739.1 hypothetical protein FUA48_14480 [Flavobacterium alkalisoli]
MKKIITGSFLLLLAAIGFLSCEKDDICAEGTVTTPNLVVEFYDKDNRTVLKNVTYFQYFTTDGDTLPSYKTYLNTNKILVPLRTNNEESQWVFSLGKKVNSDTIYNKDAITFKYLHNEIYVSRACGFKSNFILNPNIQDDPNPQVDDSQDADGLWIQDYTIEQPNIETSDEVHVKIYF